MPCARRTVVRNIALAGLAALTRVAGAASSQPYRARVLAKHPVAYWPLDEAAGPDAQDLMGDTHAGIYRGGVAFRQNGPLRDSADAAVGLNGMDAFVEVADSGAFSQPASGKGLSVEAWLRPDLLVFPGQTKEPYVHWLGKGEAGAFEWGFRFYSKNSSRPNRVSAYIWNSSSPPGVQNEGAGAYFEDELRPGAWVHIVACYDPGDARNARAGVSIFKNGVLRHGPESSPGARYASYEIRPAHGAAPVRLGTRDKRSFLSGGLAHIAIYPRVLSAREILDDFMGAAAR
jgi:hypothetical protein